MGQGYRAVQWNRQKKRYDAVLVAGIVAYLVLFLTIGGRVHPDVTIETLLIRASGTGAFVLLHLALCIGPLCRLDPRLLPLLYNRRHLGVATFALGALHGVLSTLQFHALGDLNPLVSVLSTHASLDGVSDLPFQPLGLAALAILFLMAATSHDFWLHQLSAPVWKTLHMAVYGAYVLLVAHVALGVLQSELHPVFPLLLALGVATVAGLHGAAALRETKADTPGSPGEDGWIDAGPVAEIPTERARIVVAGGERVAVFRYGGVVSAISNVCQHQNGPLGEGKIVDGCVTCPWHGYQYDPASGRSPEPFTERVPPFRTRIVEGRVWVDPVPLPPGTPVTPTPIPAPEGAR